MFNKIKIKLKPTKVIKKQLLIIFILFIILICSSIWLRPYSIKPSIDLLYTFDKASLSFKSFINILIISIRSENLLLLISIFILNFGNVFKLLLYFYIIYTSSAFSAIIKLIFRDEMLFMTADDRFNYNLNPFLCEFSWSTISSNSLLLVSTILTITYMSIQENWWTIIKILLWIVSVILIILVGLLNFLSKLYTITDIIISSLYGFMIFYFFMFIINKNLNRSKDFNDFKKKLFFLMIFLNFFIILMSISLYIATEFFILNDAYKLKIISLISHTDCFYKYPENTNLSIHSLRLTLIFISNLGALLGIYFDMKFLSNNNEVDWEFFNFKEDEKELESLYTFPDNLKNAQWNDTPVKYTIIRLILSVVIIGTCVIPFRFIKYEQDKLVLIIIMKFLIPWLLVSFCFFFFLKFVFIKLGLVNNKAFIVKNSSNTSNHSSFINKDLMLINNGSC